MSTFFRSLNSSNHLGHCDGVAISLVGLAQGRVYKRQHHLQYTYYQVWAALVRDSIPHFHK